MSLAKEMVFSLTFFLTYMYSCLFLFISFFIFLFRRLIYISMTTEYLQEEEGDGGEDVMSVEGCFVCLGGLKEFQLWHHFHLLVLLLLPLHPPLLPPPKLKIPPFKMKKKKQQQERNPLLLLPPFPPLPRPLTNFPLPKSIEPIKLETM